ncbi:hypothetical protein V8E36_003143 [Tilletia maclaganii]
MPPSPKPQLAKPGRLDSYFEVAAALAARVGPSGEPELLTEWRWTWEPINNFYDSAVAGVEFGVYATHGARHGASGDGELELLTEWNPTWERLSRFYYRKRAEEEFQRLTVEQRNARAAQHTGTMEVGHMKEHSHTVQDDSKDDTNSNLQDDTNNTSDSRNLTSRAHSTNAKKRLRSDQLPSHSHNTKGKERSRPGHSRLRSKSGHNTFTSNALGHVLALVRLLAPARMLALLCLDPQHRAALSASQHQLLRIPSLTCPVTKPKVAAPKANHVNVLVTASFSPDTSLNDMIHHPAFESPTPSHDRHGLYDAPKLAFLAHVTPAMAVEALLGTDPSSRALNPLTHDIARPYPGPAELAYLASPVSSHIQSAEMGNQSVNSMALVSGRYTVNAAETLSMMQAWMIYALCQVFDLRYWRYLASPGSAWWAPVLLSLMTLIQIAQVRPQSKTRTGAPLTTALTAPRAVKAWRRLRLPLALHHSQIHQAVTRSPSPQARRPSSLTIHDLPPRDRQPRLSPMPHQMVYRRATTSARRPRPSHSRLEITDAF